MRVAIVHDDLVQWGGAERVLEAICKIYPEAPIYTSVFDKSNQELTNRFGSKKILTSFLQKIPGWKSLYKGLLPLYSIAFEQFDFSEYDLIISHTTRFAKSVVTRPNTKHICYCHTPPRFLWHFSGEVNFGLLELYLSNLRIYDQISANRVDYFLAGSKNAKNRIKRVYQRDSEIVYPFVDLERFNGIEGFDGGYFLVISRLNKYKRVDLAIKACLKLGFPLKVVGIGPELNKLEVKSQKEKGKNVVEFLGSLSDEMVVEVMAGCRALIVPGIEDFGITSLEAQALGKPVVAFRKGGMLETVIEDKIGLFFDNQTVDDLAKVLVEFDKKKLSEEACKENANQFSKENFIKNFKQAVDDCK